MDMNQHLSTIINNSYPSQKGHTMKTGKVYITQNPMRRNVYNELVYKYDLTAAREFGTLDVLLPSGPVLISPQLSIMKMREKLRGFKPNDWLLCLGDPVVIAAASAIIAEVNNGVVPALVWDRQVKKYLAIVIDIHPQVAEAA
jgi:hypothetical protein